MRSALLLLALGAALMAGRLSAQEPEEPAARPVVARAAWLSDRRPLREGDLVTIVVDEETVARERVSTVATGVRSQRASARLGLSTTTPPTDRSVGFGMDGASRDVGEANRQGNLTAVLTARVTALDPSGAARIEGSKRVRVDGRAQEVRLSGLVRPEDISPRNLVLSSRIAEAEIEYRGRRIGPRMGIAGRILAILWP